MSVTHSPATRNAVADAILAEIDIDTGAGYVELQTSGDVECATLDLSDPAGTVSGAVLTFATISNDTSATGGTVAKFEIFSNLGGSRLLGAVGLSGSDINISSLTITPGDSVAITALTYTASV